MHIRINKRKYQGQGCEFIEFGAKTNDTILKHSGIQGYIEMLNNNGGLPFFIL